MTPWTDSAQRELEAHLNRIRPALETSAADAAEVMEDLRRHLDVEIQSSQLAIVTDQDVRRLLARLGSPEPTMASPPNASAANPPAPKTPAFGLRSFASYWLLFAGVLLPITTLRIELVRFTTASPSSTRDARDRCPRVGKPGAIPGGRAAARGSDVGAGDPGAGYDQPDRPRFGAVWMVPAREAAPAESWPG